MSAIPLHFLKYLWKKVEGHTPDILVATTEETPAIRYVDVHQLVESVPFGELKMFQLGITTLWNREGSLRNCKGEFNLVGRTEEQEYRFSTTLCWGRNAGRVVDINEYNTEWLNVLTVDPESGWLWFPTEEGVVSRCTGVVREVGSKRSEERPVKAVPVATVADMDFETAELRVTAEGLTPFRAEPMFVERSGDGYDVLLRLTTIREGWFSDRLVEEFGGEDRVHISSS